MGGPQGTVYLIHFNAPYKHARHYCGWAADLQGRLRHHRAGTGSRLMAVVTQAGIGWRVVKTWPGDRKFERQIKRNGGLAKVCPVCRDRPREPQPVGSKEEKRHEIHRGV